VQQVQNIQYVYLLNKYIKCSVWRLGVRYDIYMRRSALKGRSGRTVLGGEGGLCVGKAILSDTFMCRLSRNSGSLNFQDS